MGDQIGVVQVMLLASLAIFCLLLAGTFAHASAMGRYAKGSAPNETGQMEQVFQTGGGLIKRFIRFFSRIYHV